MKKFSSMNGESYHQCNGSVWKNEVIKQLAKIRMSSSYPACHKFHSLITSSACAPLLVRHVKGVSDISDLSYGLETRLAKTFKHATFPFNDESGQH